MSEMNKMIEVLKTSVDKYNKARKDVDKIDTIIDVIRNFETLYCKEPFFKKEEATYLGEYKGVYYTYDKSLWLDNTQFLSVLDMFFYGIEGVDAYHEGEENGVYSISLDNYNEYTNTK